MGAQWKHSGRVDEAAKRGLLFGKLSKEICIAARLGDPDPNNNPRLRAAVEAARKYSVPKDTIARAIKKGAGLLDEVINYELVTYEGMTPHKVPIIVECMTENKNRTASDVRTLFRKGTLGAIGSVAWMYDRLGLIEATHSNKSLDIEEAAIEADAQNVEPLEAGETEADQIGARFFTAPTDLDGVNKKLTEAGWVVSKSELSYIPKNYVELDGEQRKEVEEFLNKIDENDDVHRIYPALK
jgi:YebC/PmpR family DNA-binding regulatory protein